MSTFDTSFFSDLADPSNFGAPGSMPTSPTTVSIPDTSSTADSTGVDYNALNAALNPTTGSTITASPTAGNTTAGDTSGSSDVLSGLSDIFGAVGTAVSQGIKSSQNTTGIRTIAPGQLVYNPATGQYISTGVPVTSTNILGGLNTNSMFLLIAIAVVVWFVFMRGK